MEAKASARTFLKQISAIIRNLRRDCIASTALVSLLRTVLDNEPSLMRPTVGALVLKTEKDLNRWIESGTAGNNRLTVGSRLAMH